MCNTYSNTVFCTRSTLFGNLYAFVFLLYAIFYLTNSDPKPTCYAPISSLDKLHVTLVTPRMNMVPEVYKSYFKIKHSHQITDSLSQEFTLIAKTEKKAVMWNYSMGAELQVESKTNVGKVRNTLTWWAAMNPCSMQRSQQFKGLIQVMTGSQRTQGFTQPCKNWREVVKGMACKKPCKHCC